MPATVRRRRRCRALPELVLQRIDLVDEVMGGSGCLEVAVTVGEGDAGVLGTGDRVDRGEADEMEQFVDINKIVQAAGGRGHRYRDGGGKYGRHGVSRLATTACKRAGRLDSRPNSISLKDGSGPEHQRAFASRAELVTPAPVIGGLVVAIVGCVLGAARTISLCTRRSSGAPSC